MTQSSNQHSIVLVILGIIILFTDSIFAQNSVGIGTETPNPRAVLHLVSPGNNQGLLVPRLTTAQRTAEGFTASLTNADNGLLVFDDTQGGFFYWRNGDWQSVTGLQVSAGEGVTIDENGIISVAIPEAQDLQVEENQLSITGNPNATVIDLTPYLTNQTAAQVPVTPTEDLPQENVQAALEALRTQIIATGNGDMVADTYDPNGIDGDAFDLTLHTGQLRAAQVNGLGTAALNTLYFLLATVESSKSNDLSELKTIQPFLLTPLLTFNFPLLTHSLLQLPVHPAVDLFY